MSVRPVGVLRHPRGRSTEGRRILFPGARERPRLCDLWQRPMFSYGALLLAVWSPDMSQSERCGHPHQSLREVSVASDMSARPLLWCQDCGSLATYEGGLVSTKAITRDCHLCGRSYFEGLGLRCPKSEGGQHLFLMNPGSSAWMTPERERR